MAAAQQAGITPCGCVIGTREWLEAQAELEEELADVYMPNLCARWSAFGDLTILVGDHATGTLIVDSEACQSLRMSGLFREV